MKQLNANFIISAEKLLQCPDFELPEFPLLGRSNVGFWVKIFSVWTLTIWIKLSLNILKGSFKKVSNVLKIFMDFLFHF